MDGLFKLLLDRVDTNARRAVDVYISELPDFRSVATDGRARAAMLEFAVTLRRREAELAADAAPFTEQDLGMLAAFGEQRGRQGVSWESRERVLNLHDVLTLREIHEAAGLDEVAHVTEMIGWLPANGLAGQRAYTRGFLSGHRRAQPFVKRVEDLATTLLTDTSVAPGLAEDLRMRLADRYVVTVVRIADGPLPKRRADIVGALLKSHRVPMTWRRPGELVAVLPCGDPADAGGLGAVGGVGGVGAVDAMEAVENRALGLVRDFARMVGRPCAAGAATGRVRALRDAVALARRISRVAPIDTVPRRLHVVTDVFVELGVTEMPQVDERLRGLAQRLASGPDLIATLDAYYRHDMNRLRTAGALRIHPRTLDYRFRRVRELVGTDPGSTDGVRVLSAVVTLVLSGRWS
ncbi:PucR-like helix-turn-helix protein [Actinomadura pelletieri DSM 43383]|uniref:PucR-like helix-turn-helix protein n=1 Tax=Actinomadura pelletieri DSM 43383 TaxID=1120940 RepID=A0A495QZK3_9ACTN|nr:helix-turn-helix domain-containing protein [Actinomadura pelletieri]RKS79651.1 PucR-like helix-turn-helix protein [Actinomadura pelletieri DSM 43383]